MSESESSVVSEVVTIRDVEPTPAPAPVDLLSADQKAVIKIVTDLVSKKPTSKGEAIELFHSLQVQLATWLVSELPPLEKKAALFCLMAVQEVETLTSGCFGLFKK